MNSPNMGVVINLADIRAQRMSAQVTDTVIEEQESTPTLGARLMTTAEKVFWRNHMFFADRLATNPAYGAVKYQVVTVEGALMMNFTCDAFQAFYHLKPDLVIDFGTDPLLVRWNCAGEPEYPLAALPVYEVMVD